MKEVIKLLKKIEPKRDYSDSHWNFYLKINSRQWEVLRITLYDSNYYFSFAGSRETFCYPKDKEQLIDDSSSELKWIRELVPKYIVDIQKGGDYLYRKVVKELPLQYRTGLLPRKALLLNVKDIYRPEKELGKKGTAELVRWIEKNGREKFESKKPMTLHTYLEYCKVAYLANPKKTHAKSSESGLSLYKRLADNRHEGLLDIDMHSPEAFTKWHQGGRGGGGHPWEIYRGGNTTHINLGVTTVDDYFAEKKSSKFTIYLQGLSIGRLVETARIALSFIRKDMPFSLFGAEEMREKLLALDNIGLLPQWYGLHRANQSFSSDLNVYDCLHWQDLTGPERRKLKPFVTWLPLEIILPPVK